jgi:pseudaminic acid cytidylyltransferase
MRLAVLPARGGSKRIPRKNVREFAGQPMIGHAIAAARRSGLFEHIVVSTDDAEIAAIARSLGAEVPFLRPAALADDHTPTVPVVAHAMDACRALGWHADAVCCIYPCVPFLRVEDLHATLTELERGAAYAFPVAQFASPVQRALQRREDGSSSPMFPQFASVRSQDLPPAFHDAGQFYWGRAEAWAAGLNIHLHGRTIVIPHWRVVDIDTPDDWQRAELMYEALRPGQEP